MAKRWIFTGLTVAMALGLIGLLAYTSESVHHTAEPAPAITEREMGPTLHRNGLMLTH